jgi:hypothetical protein
VSWQEQYASALITPHNTGLSQYTMKETGKKHLSLTSRGLLLCSLLFCCACLTGCLYQAGREAPKPVLPAKAVWKRFQTVQPDDSLGHQGCRLKASLHFFSPQQNQRLVLELWGNYALPLRLDLKAGFGNTFALWRVDRDLWLSYLPEQQQAYTHPDSRVGIRRMGVDSPFDIQELLYLLTGHWEKLLASTYRTGRYVDNQGYRYTFAPGQRIREILLDRSGLPLVMRGGNPQDWSLRLSKYLLKQGRMIPHRVHLKNSRQEEVLILIKDIEPVQKPWPGSRLELNLPEDTTVVPLVAS